MKVKTIEIIFIFFAVFLLFEEPAGGVTIPSDATNAKTERNNWDAMKFASSHNLKLVGVNYFETKNPIQ